MHRSIIATATVVATAARIRDLGPVFVLDYGLPSEGVKGRAQ